VCADWTAETVYRDGIVRAGGHMNVMTAKANVTRRIMLFTDARTSCTPEDQEAFIDSVGAMLQEGMRLDVVIPGLATLPDYDDDAETFAAAAEEGEGSDGDTDGPPSPSGGGRPPRKRARGAPAADAMDEGEADGESPRPGSQEEAEDDEEEEEEARHPVLERAFAPDDIDAEVRARREHNAAVGGVRKTKAQARNETLLRRAAAVTGGVACSLVGLRDQLARPRKRKVGPIAKFTGTLSLSPTVHIPIRVYTATTEVRLPACRRISWAHTLEVGHHALATRTTTYSTLDKPDETLEAEDTMNAYAYGSDIVPMGSDVHETLVRCASGPKSMRVLGFLPLSTIPQHYFLGGADAVVAMSDIPEARAGLAALATAMMKRQRGAIARFVAKNDAAATLKFLWADELPAGNEDDDDDDEAEEDGQDGDGGEGGTSDGAQRQRRPFLYMVSVPLADGVRSYAFPSLQPKLDVLTSQQRAAVDNLIDAFDLDAPPPPAASDAMQDGRDDDVPGSQGSQDAAHVRGVDCTEIFNPAVHLFYAATVQRALDGVEGKTLPPLPEALAAPLRPETHVRDAAEAAAAVGRLSELLPTRRVDPKSVRKEKNFFAANPDGSARLLGAFLPDAPDGDVSADPLEGLVKAAEATSSQAAAAAAAAAAATAPGANATAPPGTAPAAATTAAGPLPPTAVGAKGGPHSVGGPDGAVAPAVNWAQRPTLVPATPAPPVNPTATGAAAADAPRATINGQRPPSRAVVVNPARAAMAPPPPVAPGPAMDEVASEMTAAEQRDQLAANRPGTVAASTKHANDPRPLAESDGEDEDEVGEAGGGYARGGFDMSALRAQMEATQRVSESQAESRLFSYATRTTGGAATATPSASADAPADPATPATVWGLGEDDPVGDFVRMLADGNADSSVAAEELTDILRSRVRTRDLAGATGALAALRSGCVKARIGEAFNSAARKLVAAAKAASPLLAGPAIAFLAHVRALSPAEGGGAPALRLVGAGEGGPGCAAVTPVVIDAFDRLVADLAGRQVGTPVPS